MSLNLKKFEVMQSNGAFARRPTVEGGHVRLFTTSAAETHTVPTDSQTSKLAQYVAFSSTADFYVTPILTAELTMVTNGTFASDTSWTKGTGWTIGSGVATSDASQTADSDLSQTCPATLIQGRSYTVSFTVTSYTAGNVTAVIGGTEGTDRSSAATFTETIIAGSTQTIALRADADFSGSVDNFTITPIAIVPDADITVGGGPDLNPTVYYLGGAYSALSLIPTGAGVINMQFYM